MECPMCKVTLVMADKQGIEIDYCPQCRGIWLDRGELEKVIERSNQPYPPNKPQYPGNDDSFNKHRDYHDDRSQHGYDKYGKKKSRGLLGDLFDF